MYVYFRIQHFCVLQFDEKSSTFHEMCHQLILHNNWRKLYYQLDNNCYEANYFEWEIDVFRKGKREIVCGLDCQGKRDFWFQSDHRYWDMRGLSFTIGRKRKRKRNDPKRNPYQKTILKAKLLKKFFSKSFYIYIDIQNIA